MRQIFYFLTFAFLLFACEHKTNKQSDNPNVMTSKTTAGKQQAIGDSIYKIGDFLFEAKKNAKFEFVRKGQRPKLKTIGDTLYVDDEILMLGDTREIGPSGIYKKFSFKSQFDEYKVEKVYQGRHAAPNFSTDPGAKDYITSIKKGCKEKGVDFAGHYTIVQWGCGTICSKMAIVDRITGQIIYSKIPFDAADGHSGEKYKIDSRMLIINTQCLSEFDGYEPGYRRYKYCREPVVYEIKNGMLKQIE